MQESPALQAIGSCRELEKEEEVVLSPSFWKVKQLGAFHLC